jgi:hypothetical protein
VLDMVDWPDSFHRFDHRLVAPADRAASMADRGDVLYARTMAGKLRIENARVGTTVV